MNEKEQQQNEHVEEIGIVLEKLGFPPMPARIVGYLLIAEPPFKTFDEIVQYTQASKSAISNALKYLEACKLVNYKTFGGDRKRYFKIDLENWSKLVENDMVNLRKFRTLLDHIVENRSDEYKDYNQAIQDISLFYQVVEDSLPELIEKWKKRKNKKK
jgi:DNA-binding transcriptional regulator GbsR (MarR family)